MTPITPRSDTVEILERLISFDTTSRHSNLACIHFIRDYLEALGIKTRLTFDDAGKKANVFGLLGQDDRPGIILSGHTDVVPVDGQDWATDPFRMTEKDGKLYGRGTSDMKAFIAATMAAAPAMIAARRKTPVCFAFSYDEEVGCLGAPRLIRDMCAHLTHRPKACIVGEPTDMRIVDAHKGKTAMRCRIAGHESHSALTHLGVNAIEAASEIIVRLGAIGKRLRDEGPRHPGFEPPYTTIHTGLIQGGTALNIVPRRCEFDFEIRTLPGIEVAPLLREIGDYVAREIEPPMRAVAPEAGVVLETVSSFPGLETDPDAEIIQIAKAITGANDTHKVSFGTEAGLFEDADIPTIVCGPGSIQQAHKPNEFIATEQIGRCDAFLEKLIDRL